MYNYPALLKTLKENLLMIWNFLRIAFIIKLHDEVSVLGWKILKFQSIFWLVLKWKYTAEKNLSISFSALDYFLFRTKSEIKKDVLGPEISNFEGGTIILKFSEKILVKEILLYLQKGRSCDFFILSGWNNFFRKVWDDLEPWFCARKWAGPGRIIKTYVKLISETGARAPLRAPHAPILYIRVNPYVRSGRHLSASLFGYIFWKTRKSVKMMNFEHLRVAKSLEKYIVFDKNCLPGENIRKPVHQICKVDHSE